MKNDGYQHPVIQALEALLRHEATGDDPAEKIELTNKLFAAIIADVDNGIAALNVTLDHADPQLRITSAWVFSELTRWGIPIDRQYQQRAEAAILTTLREGELHDKFLICILFSVNGGLSSEAIAAVQELRDGSNLAMRVGAAAALCGSQVIDSAALSALRDGLASDVLQLVAISTHALGQLARLDLRKAEAMQLLIAGLRDPKSSRQALAVEALGKIESLPAEVVDELTNLAQDEDLQTEVRAAAVFAVAFATQGTSNGRPLFWKLLKSPEWQIVHHAIRGLAAGDKLPPGLAKRLLPHLSADDEFMRRAAAGGVALLGPQAKTIVSELLTRLDLESNLMVMASLGAALAAVGDEIIPTLKARLLRGESRNLIVVVHALELIGDSVIDTVMLELLRSDQSVIRALGVQVVGCVGTKGASVVLQLSRMLDDADDADEDYIQNLISAVTACGTAGRQAIGAVVRRFQIATDETALVAMRFLRDMGSEAAAEINRVTPRATGLRKERLERALREIGGAPIDRFQQLRELGKDRLLVTFAAIGELLEREGPLGFDSLEQMIDQQKSSEFRPRSYSAATLRTTIDQLEAKLQQSLLIREQGKSSQLTPFGLQFLNLTREYLRSNKQR